MIKNQPIRGSLILGLPCINGGGINIYANYFLLFSLTCMLPFILLSFNF